MERNYSKSKETESHIILITGDVKEDWFLKHSGKTLGPRPELVHEFRTETKKLFYAYATNQFLEYSNKYFDSKIGEDVIEEVKNVLITEQIKSKKMNTSSDTFAPKDSTFTNVLGNVSANNNVDNKLANNAQTQSSE